MSFWRDDEGAVTPRGCHFGEALSHFCRHPVESEAAHVEIKAAGFDFVRFWFSLNLALRLDSFWKDRDLGLHQPDYEEQADRYLTMLRRVGLRAQASGGDVKGVANVYEDALYDTWARLFDNPQHRETVILFEGLNEARDTGDADDSTPAEIERLVNRVRHRHPEMLFALSAYTGTEDLATLKAWTPSWMRFMIAHDYRGGHLTDLIRHPWVLGYENGLIWHGEPAGVGPWVSAMDNKAELEQPGAMEMYLLGMAMSRGVPMYFSSPGVIFDRPFSSMPGFSTVCAALDLLPRDIGSWDSLFHGGASNRGKRIWAVPGTDNTRCEHIIDTRTGRVGILMHGPRWRECYPERPMRIETDHTFGAVGRLVVGQIS